MMQALQGKWGRRNNNGINPPDMINIIKLEERESNIMTHVKI